MHAFLKDFTELLEPRCSRVEENGNITNGNDDDNIFRNDLKSLMMKYATTANTNTTCGTNDKKTIILPLIQHANIGIYDESELLPSLLTKYTNHYHNDKLNMYIASPYISFMKPLILSFLDFLRNNSNNSLTIIAPSPYSHGFHNATGIKSIVPKLHIESQNNIMNNMKANIYNCNDNILRLLEFNREKWTFHSKGIWIFDKDNSKIPFLSYIGSSNFGQRSWQRDFELGFLIISNDSGISNNLIEECKHLLKYTKDSTNTDNKNPYIIKFIMKIVRSFI